MERVKSKIDLNKLNAKCERILKEVLLFGCSSGSLSVKFLKVFQNFLFFADLLIKFVLFKYIYSLSTPSSGLLWSHLPLQLG